MRQIFLVTYILISFNCLGQDTVFIKQDSRKLNNKLDYITDTVVFESALIRHIIYGTSIIPTTRNQMLAHNYGLFLTKVTQSNCQNNREENKGVPDRINSMINTDTSLTIETNIFDNCCYSFLCDLSIVDDSIVNLIYTGYGGYCFCSCCFGLTYKITKEKYDDLAKIKFVMINGNRETIRKIK